MPFKGVFRGVNPFLYLDGDTVTYVWMLLATVDSCNMSSDESQNNNFGNFVIILRFIFNLLIKIMLAFLIECISVTCQWLKQMMQVN
jgi:hypothetical protein